MFDLFTITLYVVSFVLIAFCNYCSSIVGWILQGEYLKWKLHAPTYGGREMGIVWFLCPLVSIAVSILGFFLFYFEFFGKFTFFLFNISISFSFGFIIELF